MEFLLSVAGLVIAGWILGRGDWNVYRPQLAVAWIAVSAIALWVGLRAITGWID